MTTLGEVFVRSAFRHQVDRGLPLSSSGGSAFEHLTEDAENLFIHSDLGLSLGTWDPVDGHADRSEPHIELLPGSKLRMGTGNGTRSEFEILNDGSMHWGDGTAVPDAHFARVPVESSSAFALAEGLSIGDNLDQVTAYWEGNAFSDTLVEITPVGVHLTNDGAARGVNMDMNGITCHHPSSLQSWETFSPLGDCTLDASALTMSVPGAQVRLPSPNGAWYAISVTDAGDLVATAL